MAEILLFGRKDDEQLLIKIEQELQDAFPNEDVAGMMATLRRRPLLRMVVLTNVRREIKGIEESGTQAIDWTKLIELILELLKMFM